jgi:hypothetical protein
MDTEIKKKISEYIHKQVKEGFSSREDIFDDTVDMVEDEYENIDASEAEEFIEPEIDSQFEKHYKLQETWKNPTDCDKLDEAFAAMEEQGIVGRQNFACCQTCGNAEIVSEIKEYATTKTPIGYTFYHMQDTESAAERGTLYLAFGSVTDSDEDSVEVGKKIRNILEEKGFSVEWNGSSEKRIGITGIDWKRRRDDSGPVSLC